MTKFSFIHIAINSIRYETTCTACSVWNGRFSYVVCTRYDIPIINTSLYPWRNVVRTNAHYYTLTNRREAHINSTEPLVRNTSKDRRTVRWKCKISINCWKKRVKFIAFFSFLPPIFYSFSFHSLQLWFFYIYTFFLIYVKHIWFVSEDLFVDKRYLEVPRLHRYFMRIKSAHSNQCR